MSRDPIVRSSKKLSWLLRHGALEAGVPMDAAGWVPIPAVLEALRISEEQLQLAHDQNDKSRLKMRDGKVRCSQGHSTAGTPVTAEALEATWTRWAGGHTVWHGTQDGAIDGIARSGLLPIARTHVHLAATQQSKVGKRSRVQVLLEVCPQRLESHGLPLWESPNGVLLTRRVPPDCIVGLQTLTRRAKAHEAELKRRLFEAES